ncbi:MAG: outer membrane beta-barrel protein [Hahellaceae bacterium]|nr:outer membrane beta-barrel protein [Hahellaceae bacterium]
MNRLLLAAAISVISTSTFAFDWEVPKKEGLDYASMQATYFDFRSVGEGSSLQAAMGWGTELTYGTYITDWFRTEVRVGKGIGTDNISELYRSSGNVIKSEHADVGIDYWGSWYLGAQYPIAEFALFYAEYGFSHVKGTAKKVAKPVAFKDMPNDFMSSTFSVSWIVGIDFSVVDRLYVTTEIGRLHNDTSTAIKTFRSGIGLKYEF